MLLCAELTGRPFASWPMLSGFLNIPANLYCVACLAKNRRRRISPQRHNYAEWIDGLPVCRRLSIFADAQSCHPPFRKTPVILPPCWAFASQRGLPQIVQRRSGRSVMGLLTRRSPDCNAEIAQKRFVAQGRFREAAVFSVSHILPFSQNRPYHPLVSNKPKSLLGNPRLLGRLRVVRYRHNVNM